MTRLITTIVCSATRNHVARSRPVRSARRALTLVETLVVISIIGVLASLLLPAIQSAREASRRTVCMNHTRQVALATLNYEGAHGELPAMWQSSRTAPWHNFSWRTALLPFIERQPMYDHLELGQIPFAAKNRTIVDQSIALFQCPSTPDSPRQVEELGDGITRSQDVSAGAHDLAVVYSVFVTTPQGDEFLFPGAWHGSSFFAQAAPAIPDVPAQLSPQNAIDRAKPAKLHRVKDGYSKTALLVEQAGKPQGRGSSAAAATHPPLEGAWATCDYGYFFGAGVNTHNYRDPFGFHGGAVMALCDGSVTLLSEDLPREILVALLTRQGSEIIDPDDWRSR